MKDYSPRKVNTWDEFRRVIGYFESKKDKYIFRGNRPERPLESSLDRAVRYYPPKLRDKKDVELKLLREFKRRFHQYSLDIPKDNDFLEWFSLMQHHGAPTRLLDFSYSIYIAAYFSLEHVGEECKGDNCFEIFAVRANWATKESSKKIPAALRETRFLSKLIDNSKKDLKNMKRCFMGSHPAKFACPFNPYRLTERLTLQKSVFMCPGNVRVGFEENLKSMRGWDKEENIQKITLKFCRDEVIRARGQLFDLNITRATLFPGLDGFAQSLRVNPPKFL